MRRRSIRPAVTSMASLRSIIAEQEATIQDLRTRLSVAQSYMRARRQLSRRKSHA